MAVQIDANEGQINFHNEQHKQSGLLSTWLKITRKFNEGQGKKKKANKGNENTLLTWRLLSYEFGEWNLWGLRVTLSFIPEACPEMDGSSIALLRVHVYIYIYIYIYIFFFFSFAMFHPSPF